MNILYITPYYKPAYIYGGPIVSISSMAEQLNKEGYKLTVWTTNANGTTLLNIKPNIEVLTEGVSTTYFSLLGATPLFFSPRLLLKLYRNIHSFDVIHIHTWWNLTVLAATMICFLKNVKPILSTRGMLSFFSFGNRQSFFKKAFHLIIGKFLLSQTVLHATSQREVQECLSIIPHWQYFYAPNFIEFPPQKNIIFQPKETPQLRLIFLSRIHPVKGLDLLFEVLSKVSFPWSLLLVGKGDSSYINTLKKQAEKLYISSSIIWREWAEATEKYNLLETSDIMVLTSQTENFANAVLESLLVGTPVLVSNKVGLSDYVESKNFGWVTDLNTEAIVNALTQAYNDNEKRQKIRQEAPIKIRQDFDPKIIMQQYITAYQSIVLQNKQH